MSKQNGQVSAVMESAHICYHESLVQSESSPAGNCDSVIPESAHRNVRDEDDPGPGPVHQIPPSLECGSCGLTFNIPGGDLHAAMLVHIQNPVHKLAMRGQAVVRRKDDIGVNVCGPSHYHTLSTTLHSRQSEDIIRLPRSDTLNGLSSSTASTGLGPGAVGDQHTSSNEALPSPHGHCISSTASFQELPPSNGLIMPLPSTREVSTQTVQSLLKKKEKKGKKRAADCEINPNPKRGQREDVCPLIEEEKLFITEQFKKMSSEDGSLMVDENNKRKINCLTCENMQLGSGDALIIHIFGKRHLTARWNKEMMRTAFSRMIAVITETLTWLKGKEDRIMAMHLVSVVRNMERALAKLSRLMQRLPLT